MTTAIDDYKNDSTTTVILKPGSSLSGSLELPNDKDWIKVDLQAGHTYLFDLSGEASGGGSLMLSTGVLSLYDGRGAFIDSAITNGLAYDPRMSFTPTATGTYFLQASAIANNTGSYTIKVADVGVNMDDFSANTSTAGRLPLGAYVMGQLELPNDTDWFKVVLEAGKSYVFDLATASSGGGSMEERSGILSLYDAAGAFLDLAVTNGPGDDPRLSFTASHGGTYYLQASNKEKSVGSYTLQAWQAGGSQGGAGDDALIGFIANDTLRGGAGNDRIDGGAGIDTAVYNGTSTSFQAEVMNGYLIVTDKSGAEGTDNLANVERLRFSDVSYALDINGNAGDAYRLYQAAFNREPDKVGIGFWISRLDAGTSLRDVATGFTSSAEFASLYGNNPGNAAIVNALYFNILHREPEQEGYDFWLDVLNTRKASLPEVLVAFSNSDENREALAEVIGDGFAYIPYG